MVMTIMTKEQDQLNIDDEEVANAIELIQIFCKQEDMNKDWLLMLPPSQNETIPTRIYDGLNEYDHKDDGSNVVDAFDVPSNVMWCQYRNLMIQWMYNIVDLVNMNHNTVEIAISYIDRLMVCNNSHNKNISSNDAVARTKYQLICLTCLYIAIKISEPIVISSKTMVASFLPLDNETNVTKEQLEEMEWMILTELQWRHMYPPTTQKFLNEFSNIIFGSSSRNCNNLKFSDCIQSSVINFAINHAEYMIRHPVFGTLKSSEISYWSFLYSIETLLLPQNSSKQYNNSLLSDITIRLARLIGVENSSYYCDFNPNKMKVQDHLNLLLCESHQESMLSVEKRRVNDNQEVKLTDDYDNHSISICSSNERCLVSNASTDEAVPKASNENSEQNASCANSQSSDSEIGDRDDTINANNTVNENKYLPRWMLHARKIVLKQGKEKSISSPNKVCSSSLISS